jgi:hypothetical protein
VEALGREADVERLIAEALPSSSSRGTLRAPLLGFEESARRYAGA